MTKKLELGDKPKRTRKKAEPKPGVGDMVEKVTKATGIKKAIEIFSLITGVDCGCEERKEKLNEFFRRKKLKPRCITKDEYYQLNELLTGIKKRLPSDKAKKIAKFYSSIFSTRYEYWCETCAQIWLSKIEDLKGVVNVYRKEIENQKPE